MVFCQNCGTEANQGSKFCSKCGNSLKDKISDSVVNNSEISTDSNTGLSINDSVINRSTITSIGKVILEKDKIDANIAIEKARKLANKGKIARIFEEIEKASEIEDDEELLFLRNLAYLSKKDLRTMNFEEGFKAEEYLFELYEISSNHQENLVLFILFRENHYQSKGMNHPENPNTENLYDLLEINEMPSEITNNLRFSEESLKNLNSYF
tara:strand:- start:1210 stop:1842 length:633 start_codon:yes stop_codon:yes gene_type:complete